MNICRFKFCFIHMLDGPWGNPLSYLSFYFLCSEIEVIIKIFIP